MKNQSIFQTVLLIVLGLAFATAVLIFAGVLPGFRAKQIGADAVVTFWGTAPKSTVQNLIDQVNQKNKNVYKVNYVEKDPSSINRELLEALATKTGPDLIVLPHELLFQNRNKFYILPFTSLSERQFKDNFIDGGQILKTSTGWLALPAAVDPLVLYYNKDLYNNAGLITPPTNWEEFVLNQPKLTIIDELKKIQQSAVSFGTTNNVNNFKDIISLLMLQVGVSPIRLIGDAYDVGLTAPETLTLKTPELALNFYDQFGDPLRSTYNWNRSLPLDRDLFLDGRLANYFGFASELNYLKEKNPHLNFDVTPVPRLNKGSNLSFGRFYGLAVLKNSNRANLAFSAASELAMVNHSGVKELSESLRLVPVRRQVLTQLPADPYGQVFYREAQTSFAWPDPEMERTKIAIKQMIDDTTSSRLSASSAIVKAGKDLKLIILESK